MNPNSTNPNIVGELGSISACAFALLVRNDKDFGEFADRLSEAVTCKAICGNVQIDDAWLQGENGALCVKFKLSPYFMRRAENRNLQLEQVEWTVMLPELDDQWAKGKRLLDWLLIGKLAVPTTASKVLSEELTARIAKLH
jgi:hypothetical protein